MERKAAEHSDALAVRGTIYLDRQEFALAIADLERAVVLEPDFALQFARIAMEHGSGWQFIDTYAAALAETGDFSAAVIAVETAIKDVPEAQRPKLERHLEAYRKNQPWRE